MKKLDFDIIRWGDIDQETPQIRYETCGVGRYTVLSLEGWNVCQLLQVSLTLVPRWLWVKICQNENTNHLQGESEIF